MTNRSRMHELYSAFGIIFQACDAIHSEIAHYPNAAMLSENIEVFIAMIRRANDKGKAEMEKMITQETKLRAVVQAAKAFSWKLMIKNAVDRHDPIDATACHRMEQALAALEAP